MAAVTASAALPPLLKWIGNKQRVAPLIASQFPQQFGTYYEPFLGSGALLGALRPERAVASDLLAPLMEIWQAVAWDPDAVKQWYLSRWLQSQIDAKAAYQQIRDRYNAMPNGADLLWISRSCYGGVMRFRKADGHISTPLGIHRPLAPKVFNRRVDLWHQALGGVTLVQGDFRQALATARAGDLVYCDPPYLHAQSILYGAQGFCLNDLWTTIGDLKGRGVYVALSLDGSKRGKPLAVPIPEGLFERELFLEGGRSMLLRFQREGESLENERVQDRLLLTYWKE